MASQKDSLQGVIILIGALLCQIVLGGLTLCGGIFYVIYREAFNSSPVVTSWLCSLPMTLWLMSAPLGSIVINKYGYRVCSVVGGFIAATGISLGYFANDILFLFFTHGISTGIGLGIHYTGCMAVVNSYFDKYRTAATGTISIGHNLGLVIFPFFIDYLVQKYTWRGTLLVIGGLAYNMCTLSLLFQPFKDSKHSRKDLTKKVAFDFSILRKFSFLCFCFSNILVNISTGIYLLHLPSYAKTIGFTPSDIGIVLTIYGVSNVVGKIFYSFIGQLPTVDVTMTYTVSLTATGVCISLAPVFLTRVGMMLLPGLVGFFYCVTGALLAAVIFRLVGNNRFAEGVGLAMPFKASGSLLGGPLAGFLSETSGSYTSSFVLSGFALVAASALMIYPIIYHRRRARLNVDTKHDLIVEKTVSKPSEKSHQDVKVPLIVESKVPMEA